MTDKKIEMLLEITDELKVKYRDSLILDGVEILAEVYVEYGYHPIVPLQNVELVVEHFKDGQASYNDIIDDIVDVTDSLTVLLTPPENADEEVRSVGDIIAMIPLTLFISLYAIEHGEEFETAEEMLRDGLFDKITSRLDRAVEGTGA